MEGTIPSPRTPEEDDLVKLCAALNSQGSKYIVIGGMAMNVHGMLRATEDIDLLIERSRENQNKVRKALQVLPDKAVNEMEENDLDSFTVVRVADEVVVDLMLAAGGITYDEAAAELDVREIRGVPIPFASAALLLRMKQTYRDKDMADRVFLQQKLAGNS